MWKHTHMGTRSSGNTLMGKHSYVETWKHTHMGTRSCGNTETHSWGNTLMWKHENTHTWRHDMKTWKSTCEDMET